MGFKGHPLVLAVYQEPLAGRRFLWKDSGRHTATAGKNRCLVPSYPCEHGQPCGKNSRLRTFCTQLSTVVSHSSFATFAAVKAAVTPTIHSTNNSNDKVYN